MSSQQAFPVISDTHIIDKQIILDEVHKAFTDELPNLFNDNEISLMSTLIQQPAGMMDPRYHRKLVQLS